MTTDIKLFDLTKDPATEIPGRSSAVEKPPMISSSGSWRRCLEFACLVASTMPDGSMELGKADLSATNARKWRTNRCLRR